MMIQLISTQVGGTRWDSLAQDARHYFHLAPELWNGASKHAFKVQGMAGPDSGTDSFWLNQGMTIRQ